MNCFRWMLPDFAFLFLGVLTLKAANPVPELQIIPLPDDQASIQRSGLEITRYHFGKHLRRPFLYPVNGPAGRPLTRMGHPRDPISHSHHNSVWIAHQSVDGVSFWEDRGPGQILQDRLEGYYDDEPAGWTGLEVLNLWQDQAKKRVVLKEKRRIMSQTLPSGEWWATIEITFESPQKEVTFGKTPFGLLGVRVAKTIGVTDGGGVILNSEGDTNEQQVLGKRAQWVDYSGPVIAGREEGIALFDHPENPNHPSYFHVRNDGWMCASLTYDQPRVVRTNAPLRLRYALYVHHGRGEKSKLQQQWKTFALSARQTSGRSP